MVTCSTDAHLSQIAVTAVDTEGRPPAAAQLVATVLKAGRGDDSFAAGEEVRLPWADMQAVRLLERTESSSACGDYSPSMLESSSVTIGPAAAAAAEASDATTPPGQGFVNTAVDTMPAQEGSEGEEYLGADGDEDLSLFDMFAQIIEEKKLSLAAS